MKLAIAGCAFAVTILCAGPPDAVRGREAFEKRCSGCHGLDQAKEGPPLRGVYQRKAGSVKDFPYSDALKKAEWLWDEQKLDRWLADPEQLAPGNEMAFRLDQAQERRDIVAWLKGRRTSH